MKDKDLGGENNCGRAKKELRDAWTGTKPAKSYRGDKVLRRQVVREKNGETTPIEALQ